MDLELADASLAFEIAPRQHLETAHRLNRADQMALQVNLARRDVRIDLSTGANHQKLGGLYFPGKMAIDLDRQIVAKLAGNGRIGEQYGSWRCALNKRRAFFILCRAHNPKFPKV